LEFVYYFLWLRTASVEMWHFTAESLIFECTLVFVIQSIIIMKCFHSCPTGLPERTKAIGATPARSPEGSPVS